MKNQIDTYDVEFLDAAVRDLKKLPKNVQGQIVELADDLAKLPRPEGVESLTQFKGMYRVRVGHYRVIYTVNDKNKVVIVAAVGNRKNIYELLERRFI